MAAAVPDPPLLKALQNRDQAALSTMIQTCTDPLLGAAWGLGWSGADAEDLVQDTFLTFLNNPGNFQGRSSLKTYLIGILYWKSREKRKSNSREQATDPVDDVFENRFGFAGAWRTKPRGPEDEALSKETIDLVMACAESLSDDQRLAFYLREVEQETTEDACNILAITPTHLGVLLFRARNKIRECIQKKWESRR
jgi:RNA polymerase sigma-70 factor, ECF subfamily